MPSLFKLLLASVLACSTAGCVTVESAAGVDRVYQATAADTLSTAIALNQGGVELNPLGFHGSTMGKLFYLYIRKDLPEDVRQSYDRTATAVWTGAAANNTLQILVPGVGLGASLGLGIWVALSIWDSW